MRLSRLVALLAVALCSSAVLAATPLKSRHVVFVVSDGLRWQEVFTGADPVLLGDKDKNWTEQDVLKARYWDDDAQRRREKLFPFIWGTLAKEGQIFGNRIAGSDAHVTNPYWFSYPGYNEMSSGVADPAIDSNRHGLNANVTVYEWLNRQPALKGSVEIFGTWQTFHDIFNDARSGLPVRSGTTLVDRSDKSPRGQLLAELYDTTPSAEDPDPNDALLHVELRDHLAKHHPKVLFVGYGDTDNWAHMGRYDTLLDAAHHVDAFVAELWQQLQADPEYRGTTTLIFTCDHGRGRGRADWVDHGVGQPGSNEIWIGVMGPDVPALGERMNVGPVTQSQLAATIAAFVGEDFRTFKPAAAPSLFEAFGIQ